MQYRETNEGSPVSPAAMWDPAKATIRGHIITHTSLQKQLLMPKKRDLESEVFRLEKRHKNTPSRFNLAAL